VDFKLSELEEGGFELIKLVRVDFELIKLILETSQGGGKGTVCLGGFELIKLRISSGWSHWEGSWS